jgi:hypothetical protein
MNKQVHRMCELSYNVDGDISVYMRGIYEHRRSEIRGYHHSKMDEKSELVVGTERRTKITSVEHGNSKVTRWVPKHQA